MFAATAAADAVQRYLDRQRKQGDEQLDALDTSSTSTTPGTTRTPDASDVEISESKLVGCDVIVFEGTSRTMSKVRISGGGRVSTNNHRGFIILCMPY